MKKKNILKLILLFIFIGFGINFAIVRADSGWDSDYDSFGSFDFGSASGSSSGGSYSYDSSSGFISLKEIFYITIIIIIIAIIVEVHNVIKERKETERILNNYNNKDKKIENASYENNNSDIVNEDEIKKVLPTFNKRDFLSNSFENFVNIQNAWSNFNYDELKKYLSDELFTTYKSQLKILNAKKQKNVMNEFENDLIDIIEFDNNKGKSTIKVILYVSFYDYVIDKDNNVVRGDKNTKMKNIYELTFISSKVSKNKDIKCPNCNAKLDSGPTSVCPYCKSKIVHDNYDWVLSKKEMKGRY